MSKTKLSPRRQRFVNAYLGEAAGNATKAAIIAGYSERSAYSQAHELLKNPEIQAAVGRTLDREQMTADESMREVSAMARAKVEQKDIRAQDKLKANELILKVLGKLHDKRDDSGSRVTVNIGFLQGGQPVLTTHSQHPHSNASDHTTTRLAIAEGMGQPLDVEIVRDGEA